MPENSPCSERMAARAASREPASMRSATASACARSILSLRKARSVNSPGARAARAELQTALDQLLDDHRTAVPLQFEHVFAGVGMRPRKEQRDADVDRVAAARSMKRRERGVARRRQFSQRCVAAISGALGPETRTTPTPPRPGGDAAATMVSG